MSWSLGEVRALAVKAARGAGLSWGMAEEAGYACQSLEQLGLPGTEILARLLVLHDNNDHAKSLLAAVSGDEFRALTAVDKPAACNQKTDERAELVNRLHRLAGQRSLCPLLLGTMISDGLLGQSSPQGLPLGVSQVGLLLPFLTQSISQPGADLRVLIDLESKNCQSNSLHFSIQSMPLDKSESIDGPTAQLWISADWSCEQAIETLLANHMRCHWTFESLDFESPGCYDLQAYVQLSTTPRRRVADNSADSIRQLTSLAARTYAPETDESREKGAGAGTTDND